MKLPRDIERHAPKDAQELEDVNWARHFVAECEELAECHGGNMGSFVYEPLRRKLNELRVDAKAQAYAEVLGLLGMFEAIRWTHFLRIVACNCCLKHRGSWVGAGAQRLCMPCWNELHFATNYRCFHESPFLEHHRQFRPCGSNGF